MHFMKSMTKSRKIYSKYFNFTALYQKYILHTGCIYKRLTKDFPKNYLSMGLFIQTFFLRL